MDRISVVSSNLKSVGFDGDSQILEIEFRSGSVYRYRGVSRHVYEGLMSAASKGSYFDRHIRNGPYPYRQVR